MPHGRVIDLSMTIEPHFRWKPEQKVLGDFSRGDVFQVTCYGCVVHGFTHIDAPSHIDPAGTTTSDFRLEQVTGEAAVIDLSGIAPNTPIDAALLAGRAKHLRDGDLAVLKTGWDTQRDAHQPAFWTDAPYMTRGACEWLLDKAPRAVGFDFPQDYPIRGLLTGQHGAREDFVTHDTLLRNGVLLIEYLCNLRAVQAERTTLLALPIKLAGADGAPARVVALED